MKRRNLFLILLGASWLAGGSVNARGDEEPEAELTDEELGVSGTLPALDSLCLHPQRGPTLYGAASA